jgi:hypothetical protein
MKSIFIKIGFVLCIYAFGSVQLLVAQEKYTAHTFTRGDGLETSVDASLEHFNWMIGQWVGSAFGGSIEEHWSAPTAGSMVGTFKLMHENVPTMYEIQLLMADSAGVRIRLKHFNADLTGWEEKDAFVTFPLLKIAPGAAYFDGLTYQRVHADSIQIFLAVGQRGGGIREESIGMRRVE